MENLAVKIEEHDYDDLSEMQTVYIRNTNNQYNEPVNFRNTYGGYLKPINVRNTHDQYKEPVNVRNTNDQYKEPVKVRNANDQYKVPDMYIPRVTDANTDVKRGLKQLKVALAVVVAVLSVVLLAVIGAVIYLGIREGTGTNGGWSVWAAWTDCSATCNTGLQSRQRQCNNPEPSSGGQNCQGSPMDVELCNKQQCPRARSSFLAKNATRLSNGILSFSAVLFNEGSNFYGDSGTFTCQQSGLYFFTVNVIEGGRGANIIDCYILRNYYAQVNIYFRIGNDTTIAITQDGYGAATGSGTFHLTNGDRVNVLCNPETSSFFFTSFTGFLIAEDP